MISTLIRWILTALLIYGVYTETGFWTAVFCSLMSMGLELAGARVNKKG